MIKILALALMLRQAPESFRLDTGPWLGATDASSVGDTRYEIVVDVALAAPLFGPRAASQLVIGVRDREGLRSIPYRVWAKANASAPTALLHEDTAPPSGSRRDVAARVTRGTTILVENLSVPAEDPARWIEVMTVKDPTAAFTVPFATAFRFPSQGAARSLAPDATEVLYPKQRGYLHGAIGTINRLLGRTTLADQTALDWELASQFHEGTSSGRSGPPSLSYGHHEPLELVLQAPARHASSTATVAVYRGTTLVEGFPRRIVLPRANAPIRIDLAGLEPAAGRDFPTGRDDYDLQVLVTIAGKTYAIVGVRQGLQNLTNPVPNGVSFPY